MTCFNDYNMIPWGDPTGGNQRYISANLYHNINFKHLSFRFGMNLDDLYKIIPRVWGKPTTLKPEVPLCESSFGMNLDNLYKIIPRVWGKPTTLKPEVPLCESSFGMNLESLLKYSCNYMYYILTCLN